MRPLIFFGDFHLTHQKPRFRTDTYFLTGLRKLEFILQEAEKRQAVLVSAGDMFDRATGPLWYVNMVMDLLLNYNQYAFVYAVVGNHDQHFHNPDVMKAQIGTLILAEAIGKLKGPEWFDGVQLYGRSWNEAYPEPTPEANTKQILVAHTCVTKGTPPPWLSAVSAVEMIEAHPGFDYIVSADFHEKFVVSHNGCTLINTGPVLRAEIDKRDVQPACWLIDEGGVTEILIPIEDDVFDLEGVKAATESGITVSDSQLQALVDSLDFTGREKPRFDQIVMKLVEELVPDQAELKATIEEVLDYVQQA